MTMAAYPDEWRWTNGIQQERARMLLPLAWLVRVEDTPEHREWLRTHGQRDAAPSRTPAAPSARSSARRARAPTAPPSSNEEYGTNEAPLIQQNGDPVCRPALHHQLRLPRPARGRRRDRRSALRGGANKLAEFLCRIQVRSEAHPELDGGWFRAFDFNRWEYWASNARRGLGRLVHRDRLDAGLDRGRAGHAAAEDLAMGS